jgi:hypothetical protein
MNEVEYFIKNFGLVTFVSIVIPIGIFIYLIIRYLSSSFFKIEVKKWDIGKKVMVHIFLIIVGVFWLYMTFSIFSFIALTLLFH